jgi:hypothetical protein
MYKTSIHWLMIILIATQSVWSMADTHSGHQSGVEHLEFEHSHKDSHNENTAVNQGSSSQQTDFDCHHCCHCHGAHSSFITSLYSTTSVFGQSPQHSFANQLALAQQPNAFFRPPRT